MVCICPDVLKWGLTCAQSRSYARLLVGAYSAPIVWKWQAASYSQALKRVRYCCECGVVSVGAYEVAYLYPRHYGVWWHVYEVVYIVGLDAIAL
jgi:hypothetical protein